MQTIRELINDPTTKIIDVRSPLEFQIEHIPGAINIPLENIMSQAEALKSLKVPLVIYCRSGNRSGMAQSLLQQVGLKEVYNGGGLYDMQINLN